MNKLKQKGQFLELPIIGLKISNIIYNGMVTLVFDDLEESYLDIHSVFIVSQYNQQKELSQRKKESLVFFHEQYGQVIKEAKASKEGVLFVEFENGTSFIVEDGPYENWHYTKKSTTNKMDALYVHGGVGSTIYNAK